MNLIRDFLGLLYDLVIGDCWQIAAGAAAVLLLGIGLLKAGAVPAAFFSSVLGLAIMIVAALIIYLEARINYTRLVRRIESGENAD
jgi:hypothetical protein